MFIYILIDITTKYARILKLIAPTNSLLKKKKKKKKKSAELTNARASIARKASLEAV